MKLQRRTTFYLVTSFITISAILALILPREVFAKDHCPSESGSINQDTTWTEKSLYNNQFDCSETDLVIDGAILTLQVPSDLEYAGSLMNTKSLRFKNNGDVKVKIRERTLVEKQFETLVEIVSKPYNVGQVVAGTSVALQLLSFSTLFSIEKLSIASISGIISQLLFGKSKCRNLWGVVYNSANTQPIPFAVIRLFDAKSKTLLTTTVTDLDGRYGFPVTSGLYYIEVNHDEFTFPSESAIDKARLDTERIYQGGKFTIEEETSIDFNIPIDPKTTTRVLSLKIFSTIWSKLKSWTQTGNTYFLTFIFILNLVLTIFRFNIINVAFAILYFLIIVLKLISTLKKPQAWGVIFNSQTRVPIPSAFVKMYKEKTNELVDTKITDKRGRYQFFVPQGKYLLLVAATGFKFPSEKVKKEELVFHQGLLQVDSETGILNLNIPIDPTAQVSASPFSG